MASGVKDRAERRTARQVIVHGRMSAAGIDSRGSRCVFPNAFRVVTYTANHGVGPVPKRSALSIRSCENVARHMDVSPFARCSR